MHLNWRNWQQAKGKRATVTFVGLDYIYPYTKDYIGGCADLSTLEFHQSVLRNNLLIQILILGVPSIIVACILCIPSCYASACRRIPLRTAS